MNVLVAERERVEEKRRYVLIDGLDVYEMRLMDKIAFERAQERALSTVLGGAWWEGVD